ncbi:MAG: BrnT family toxin [Bacillota bacterium]
MQKIVEKIERKHNLSKDEVEHVFINDPHYRFLEKGKINSENVYAIYGRVDSGRYLTVIFIRKFNNRALIITARDMDRKERKQYEKQKNRRDS